jgi:predicted transcriptional regulator
MPKRKKSEEPTGPGIDDQLKQAVVDCDLTNYRLAKRAGLPLDKVGRFLAGSDIRLSTAAKIARVLGLELKPKEA